MARYSSYGELDTQYAEDLDSNFRGFNTRLRSDGLQAGMLQQSDNFRFQREGVAQVRKSITVTKAPLTLSDTNSFTLPFYVYGDPDGSTTTSNNITTTALTFGGVNVIATVPSDFYAKVQASTIINVGAITGAVDYTPGNYSIISKMGANQISLNLSGNFSSASGNTTLGAPELVDSQVTAVYGSTLFEDPTNEGEPYILIAGNAKAVAVKLSDQSTVDITYDSGAVEIGQPVNLIQAFNRVFLFRKGKTALEWNGTLTGSPNFTKVASGSFTQPSLLDSSNNTVITNGKVTVSETGHGLDNGDTVVIVDKGSSGLTNADEYRVNVDSVDQFHFFANVDDLTSHTVGYIKRVSRGGGYTHMPASEYGIFHQDRLVVPFTHNDASTPVSRGIIDEIAFSQLEGPDIFDPVFGSSRMYQGGDDKVMGLFSFTGDRLLCFMRDSIYLFENTASLEAAGMTKQLLTKDIGLVARRSVIQVGNQVLFLSDNGVYGLSFQDLYNLRGNDTPLSESIQSIIDDINKEYWQNSVGIYYDNRYYLAVPTGDSQVNNTILIFNFLNQQWESKDTVGKTDRNGANVNWDIENLIVAGSGNDRGVYAVNTLGGIHKIDSSDTSSFDEVITQIGGTTKEVPIAATMRTRQYNFKSIDRKKWNTFELQTQSSDSLVSDMDIKFITENIDDTIEIGSLSDFNGRNLNIGEDVSIRGRIGNRRAYGCDVTLTPTTGKPKIKVIKVMGALTFNSTQNAR
jgi:hypothetical protein